MKYTDLIDHHDNQIVFKHYDEQIYIQIIAILTENNFFLIERFVEKNGDIHEAFQKENSYVSVWKCFSYDGLFLFMRKVTDDLFQGYLSRCPKCGEKEIIKSIRYNRKNSEDISLMAAGKLDFLPAAYDRPVVPISNYNCAKCKFGWHNRKDFLR